MDISSSTRDRERGQIQKKEKNIGATKGVLLCSFTKSCFGSVLEHALMLGGSKIALLFTLFTLLQYLSPQPGINVSISSGFNEGPPSEKRNVL